MNKTTKQRTDMIVRHLNKVIEGLEMKGYHAVHEMGMGGDRLIFFKIFHPSGARGISLTKDEVMKDDKEDVLIHLYDELIDPHLVHPSIDEMKDRMTTGSIWRNVVTQQEYAMMEPRYENRMTLGNKHHVITMPYDEFIRYHRPLFTKEQELEQRVIELENELRKTKRQLKQMKEGK